MPKNHVIFKETTVYEIMPHKEDEKSCSNTHRSLQPHTTPHQLGERRDYLKTKEGTDLALNRQLMSKKSKIVREFIMGCDNNAFTTGIKLWSSCSSKYLSNSCKLISIHINGTCK